MISGRFVYTTVLLNANKPIVEAIRENKHFDTASKLDMNVFLCLIDLDNNTLSKRRGFMNHLCTRSNVTDIHMSVLLE